MDIPSLFQQLGIALGLGLPVGLQRESAASPLAGVRTFPLVTVLGTVCGLLSHISLFETRSNPPAKVAFRAGIQSRRFDRPAPCCNWR
jgi:hypothetical protein